MASTIRGSDNFDSSTPGIGYGQSWQDVTASRAAGTTYTNSTGKPIQIYFDVGNSGALNVTIGGITAISASNLTVRLSFIIPNGSTYSVSSGSSINKWMELR